MSKQIKSTDLIEKGVFDQFNKDADAAIAKANQYSEELNKVVKAQLKYAESLGLTAKDYAALSKAESEQSKALKEKQAIDKQTLQLQKQLQEATDENVKGKLRLQKANAEQRKALKAEIVLNDELAGTEEKLKAANVKLRIERSKLIKGSKGYEESLRRINAQIDKNNEELKENSDSLKKQRLDIGKYKSALDGLKGALTKLGIAFGLVQIKNFLTDLNTIAQQSEGVAFAFKALGQEGADAFDRIKASTRGLMSDLDIQKALVNFDNFNISLEETDTLMEFLAVRSAQTGESVEKLQSSLVEGLSKESKLRIDNLGISAMELNAELEKTPNFVQAVANIAKREVAEAGDILDEAANGQERWNVQMENFKLILAQKVKPIFDKAFEVGASVLKFVGENLETIIPLVLKLASVIGVYTASMQAAKIASNLTGKALGGLKKSFGLVGLAVTALIFIVSEFVSTLQESFDAYKNIEKVQGKIIEQTNVEIYKMKLLRDQLLDTNITMEERGKLIEEINAQYGTTLQNLEDETAFVQQLAVAYKEVISQLRNKIAIQIYEEELLNQTKAVKNLEAALESYEDNIFNSEVRRKLSEEINERKKAIAEIEKLYAEISIKDLGNEVEKEIKTNDSQTTSTRITKEIKENKTVIDQSEIEEEIQQKNREQREQDLINQRTENQEILLENERKNAELIEKINQEQEQADLDRLEREKEAIREKAELEKKVWNQVRDQAEDLNNLITKNIDARIKGIDTELSKINQLYDDSIERENELKELAKEGNLDAQESLEAEREKQKALKQQELELNSKQQKLEALISFLNAYAAKIAQGDGNPLANIKADILNAKSFIEGKFFTGTETTVNEALGYKGGRDSHFVAVDGNESVFTGALTSEMGIGRGRTTQDVADIVKLFDSTANKALTVPQVEPIVVNSFNSRAIELLERLNENTLPSKQVKSDLSFNAITGALEYTSRSKGSVKTVRYKVRK